LKSAGAQKIISVELKNARKEYALEFGADLVLDPTEVDVVEEVMKLTDNKGVDAAFETTGVQAGFEAAVKSVEKSGRVVVTSIWEEPVKFHLNDLVLSEKEIIGTLAYNSGVFPAVISLVKDGRIDAPKMITKEIQLEDVVGEAFDELIANKDKHIKILVNPS
jgi:(R,R)-butanediol dehydrogenase/meso-butanediol dehydrogenase/diacetyl reductase